MCSMIGFASMRMSGSSVTFQWKTVLLKKCLIALTSNSLCVVHSVIPELWCLPREVGLLSEHGLRKIENTTRRGI